VTLRGVTAATVVLLVASATACRRFEPKQELELVDMETYWVVDASSGETRYLAPAVRFHVRNKGPHSLHSVEATAVFKRKGETQTWGSDWRKVTPPGRPLAPGAKTLLVLRSDGRYSSPGTPESMFQHELFVDAAADVFLRVGSSSWEKFTTVDVERRVGSHAAQVDGS
jgi:hypothetical protein